MLNIAERVSSSGVSNALNSGVSNIVLGSRIGQYLHNASTKTEYFKNIDMGDTLDDTNGQWKALTQLALKCDSQDF